jgi:hypothetical protein
VHEPPQVGSQPHEKIEISISDGNEVGNTESLFESKCRGSIAIKRMCVDDVELRRVYAIHQLVTDPGDLGPEEKPVGWPNYLTEPIFESAGLVIGLPSHLFCTANRCEDCLTVTEIAKTASQLRVQRMSGKRPRDV